ncbi:MAG: hypothetical protein CO108_02210 [Deltaproteobacteria bacterium CG_4_9_14_3_um_filter_63_12]|nr:MAG: hypothetical protein CO108_02210 [Deltaproteobacteria bacterium CG_4_9_14_3_um_filter_63_12]
MLYVYVITASVLVHLALLPVWVFWLSAKGLFEAGPVRTVCEKARQVAEAQRPCESALSCAEQRMQVALLEEAPDPEEKEKKEPEIVDMQTVVAPKDVEESEPPVDAKLASTVDSSVEKESVAKSDHYGLTSGASSPTVAKATTASQSRSREQEVGERAEHDPEQGKSVDVPELTEDDGGKKGVQAEPIDPLDDGKKGPDIVLPDFDSERLAAVGSDGGTVDYLNGVDEDNKTLLNRKRMSYADFFERVKQGVASHWDPAYVYRRRDPSGRIYGVEDRLTVLNVTLNGDGSLDRLYVDQASGLDFLDDEAMRAMNEAVPFPNPPEGMKDLNGDVNFKFGFYFEISTRRFRVFRYR